MTIPEPSPTIRRTYAAVVPVHVEQPKRSELGRHRHGPELGARSVPARPGLGKEQISSMRRNQ
jgi:hypothetical protein